MFEVLLGSFFISLVSIIILMIFFSKKSLWWEILILIIISLLFGMIFRLIAVSNITKDIEYWGTSFQRVEYYEDWNEEVPCSHSYDCFCSTDSDGNECCCMTCYYHSYDVDYHPERFVKVDNKGSRFDISKQEYLRLKNKMENSSFNDLNRDYHDNDGDMYYTSYNGIEKDFECISTSHSYENKPQVLPNVFNYPEVTDFQKEQYGIHEYPEPSNRSRYYQKGILGYDDPLAEHKVQLMNGQLGSTKEVKTFFIIFRNKSLESANIQENYWKGGNKNEVVVMINLDNSDKPTWCKVMSWSDKEEFKINIRNHVMDMDRLNMLSVVNISREQIEKGYERKKFRDFDYLTVKLSSTQFIWLFIISVVINILLSLFIVQNEWEEESGNSKRFKRFNRFRR